MNDKQFARLLEFFGGSWKGYRKVRKGVKKRVSRHMKELECRSMDEYIRRLSVDPDAREECRRRMSVPISRFFRERILWEILKEKVFPEIIDIAEDKVRVWCAGCAGGEEPYSLRIAWTEASGFYSGLPPMNIIATDLNPHNLERAEKGVYPEGSLREVDDDRKSRFFDKIGGKYIVQEEIRKNIDWRVHDLLSDDPPGKNFDLLFLRNSILTYEESRRRNDAFFSAVSALRPGGFLVTGAREEIPVGGKSVFEPFDRYIFRKIKD